MPKGIMVAAMELEFEEKQGAQNGREKMNQEPRTGNLVDTTDCLEAVSVIRCWKNFLFIIILLALLLVQASFWLVNFERFNSEQPTADTDLSAPVADVNSPDTQTTDKIRQAAKQIAYDSNAVAAASEQPLLAAEPNRPDATPLLTSDKVVSKTKKPSLATVSHWFYPRQNHISAIVRFLNFVLIPSALLYCLTMLFSFKVSLIGRLGGINHIARAFFLSLLFLVLLLPWQLLFAPVFAGAMFTPSELINACQAQKTPLAYVSMFLRFTGYWLLVLLLLLFAQIRSMRWARATLRRLEVI
ncbi:MAG: hypothetical protein ABII09_04285 [Planctomycetota bacterium]